MAAGNSVFHFSFFFYKKRPPTAGRWEGQRIERMKLTLIRQLPSTSGYLRRVYADRLVGSIQEIVNHGREFLQDGRVSINIQNESGAVNIAGSPGNPPSKRKPDSMVGERA
jgi:hypothetical protein